MLRFLILFISCLPLWLSSSVNLGDPKNKKLTVFEGSDWCLNCIKFEKNILTDSTFVQFLKDQHIKLVRVDFPQRKKLDPKTLQQNNKIAEALNFKGSFPTIFLHTDRDKPINIVYTNQSTSEFIDLIQSNINSIP